MGAEMDIERSLSVVQGSCSSSSSSFGKRSFLELKVVKGLRRLKEEVITNGLQGSLMKCLRYNLRRRLWWNETLIDHNIIGSYYVS